MTALDPAILDPTGWSGKESVFNERLLMVISGRGLNGIEAASIDPAKAEAAKTAWSGAAGSTKVCGTALSSIATPLFDSTMGEYGFDAATQGLITGVASVNPGIFAQMVTQAIMMSSAPRPASKWTAASTKMKSGYNRSLRKHLNNGGITARYSRQQGRAQDWLDVAREAEAQGVVFEDKVQWTKGGSFDKVGDIQGAVDTPSTPAPAPTVLDNRPSAHPTIWPGHSERCAKKASRMHRHRNQTPNGAP